MNPVEVGLLLSGALLGRGLWTLVEYVVHRYGHSHAGLVQRGHYKHHAFAHVIFTGPVWIPVLVAVVLVLVAALGPACGLGISAGLFCGFVTYEAVHWRIHFSDRLGEREQRLRRHHFAHHCSSGHFAIGVTTDLWDRVFRTMPTSSLLARADAVHPVQVREGFWRGFVRSSLFPPWVSTR